MDKFSGRRKSFGCITVIIGLIVIYAIYYFLPIYVNPTPNLPRVINGKAIIQNPDGDIEKVGWRDVIPLGSKVITEDDDVIELEFPDKSQIQIGSNSDLTLVSAADGDNLFLTHLQISRGIILVKKIENEDTKITLEGIPTKVKVDLLRGAFAGIIYNIDGKQIYHLDCFTPICEFIGSSGGDQPLQLNHNEHTVSGSDGIPREKDAVWGREYFYNRLSLSSQFPPSPAPILTQIGEPTVAITATFPPPIIDIPSLTPTDYATVTTTITRTPLPTYTIPTRTPSPTKKPSKTPVVTKSPSPSHTSTKSPSLTPSLTATPLQWEFNWTSPSKFNCDAPPDIVELKVQNNSSVIVQVEGSIFAQPDGGSEKRIAYHPLDDCSDWCGPEETIQNHYPGGFTGRIWGTTYVYYQGQEVARKTRDVRTTCGSSN